MKRCKRDSKGRFAKHDIVRKTMQWACNKCGLIVPTILLSKAMGVKGIRG